MGDWLSVRADGTAIVKSMKNDSFVIWDKRKGMDTVRQSIRNVGGWMVRFSLLRYEISSNHTLLSRRFPSFITIASLIESGKYQQMMAFPLHHGSSTFQQFQ